LTVTQRRSVVIEVRAGESLQLAGKGPDQQSITVTLERKTGHRARLRITAGEDVTIVRAPLPLAVAG
jgi:hypothetical protein